MDVELIAMMIGLPLVGIDLVQYLRKYQETLMIARVKDKYDLTMANKGFIISSINDYTIRFVTKVLSCKILCKLRLNQCTMGAVALAKLCVNRV